MYQTPEQLIALNKSGLEAALKLANVALLGAERLMEVQLKAAKGALADGMQNARAVACVRDFDQLAALKDTLVQPTFDKATAYAKDVYDVAVATQAGVGRIVEEQLAEFNRQVVTAVDQLAKNAPAGSEVGIAAVKSTLAAVNAGFENLSKLAGQLREAGETNVQAAANTAADSVKNAARKAA